MKTLKIMCDYLSTGLWIDGYGIEIEDLPKEVHFLKDRVNIWQDTFENLMIPFLERDWSESRDSYLMFEKEQYSKQEFKDFIEEGRNISIEFRKILKNYKVVYFNEITQRLEEIIKFIE